MFEINFRFSYSFNFIEIKYVEEEKMENYLFNRLLYCVLIEQSLEKVEVNILGKMYIVCHTISVWTTNPLSQYVLLINAAFENISIDCSMVMFNSVHYSKVLSKEFKYASLSIKKRLLRLSSFICKLPCKYLHFLCLLFKKETIHSAHLPSQSQQ